MSRIVDCPSCHRKVRVPDELLGKLVRCPSCEGTFTATAVMGKVAPTTPPPEEQPHPQEIGYDVQERRPQRRQPILRTDDEDQETGDYSYERRPRRRAGLPPHRGTLILVLGILGLVVCGFLGPVAWIMGNTDLREIRAGRMDPEGEGQTQAGKVCGIIGTVLLVVQCCAGISISFALLGAHGHRF